MWPVSLLTVHKTWPAHFPFTPLLFTGHGPLDADLPPAHTSHSHLPCSRFTKNRRNVREHGALSAIQHPGVVGEPGGSGRGECVRGAVNNRASHRSPRSRHRFAPVHKTWPAHFPFTPLLFSVGVCVCDLLMLSHLPCSQDLGSFMPAFRPCKPSIHTAPVHSSQDPAFTHSMHGNKETKP